MLTDESIRLKLSDRLTDPECVSLFLCKVAECVVSIVIIPTLGK